MRGLIYSVAMSLDGFVAGPNGEVDWILMDPGIDFSALMGRFDTLLMGRKTFEATRAMGGAGSTTGFTTIVVSRTLRPEDHPDLTIVSHDLGRYLERLKAEPGKAIWLFGGGELFRSLLDLGQVDGVEVAVIPALLGDGVPLLAPGPERTILRLVGSRVYEATGTVMLEYTVKRPT